MAYTNSGLVTYKNLSPNHSGQRNHIIDTVTVHCIVGQWTAKQGCDFFANSSVQASPNYVVGTDGIGLSVEERNRSWCTSNSANDHRAVTIEVASDTTHPYAVTDKVLESLIKLLADICKRNNIKKLIWSTNKSDRVNHKNGCNMTVHRDYANKSCPGDYLYNKHGYIANEVNKLVGSTTSKPTTNNPSTSTLTKGTKLSLSNVALYVSSTAKMAVSTKSGTYYTWDNEVINGRVRITNSASNVGEAGQVTGWISESDAKKSVKSSSTANSFKSYLVRITSENGVNIRKGAGTNYAITGSIAKGGAYTIVAESSGQGAKKWGKLKSGAGWIALDYTEKIK